MSEKTVHAGHRARMRERFMKEGLSGFSEHEVLEFLLMFAIPQRDVNPLAHRLIDRFGSLSAVLESSPAELTRVDGVGENAAALLSLMPQLMGYYQHSAMGRKPVITNLAEARKYAGALFFGLHEERVYMICVDQSGRVLHPALMHRGTIDQVQIYPREVVETALDRFEAFHAILDEYNARMDLTAVLDEDERVDRHDLDSAAPLAHGLLVQGAKVIDVGTGAGFPGMPLLILRPDLQITFLDALNKRILFLEDALKRLGLTAATLHARAEDAAKMAAHREQYDAAVSRAVANAATLEELTLPFVKKGGVAIAWKGPGVADELTAARRAAFLLGGTVRGTVDAPIPRRADWAHVLLLTDKTGTTPKAYPRKAGTPGKKPLGM